MGATPSLQQPIGQADSRTSSNVYVATNEPLQNFPRERKKKITGFATLRRKFIRRRRSSKTCDHGRVMRDLVADWTPCEIGALLEEYEALAALKDLSVQAELARPPAATYKQDLCALYDFKCCTDIELVFRGVCFPVHRAILSVRCPYFRDLLAGCPGHGARICLELRTPSVDVATFSALLRYLYTGDVRPEDGVDLAALQQLGQEFGMPAPLERDLRALLESGDYADAALVFTHGGEGRSGGDFSVGSEYGFRPKVELPCHKAILSARSPFFRSIIQRRTRAAAGAMADEPVTGLNMLQRIVLDESVIPRRYARLLLHVIYSDTVDLSLIMRSTCASLLSLSDVGANVGGTARASSSQNPSNNVNCRLSALDEAMELYQIGRFLELDILAQGCEDLILEGLTLDSLPTVLRWGSLPHGSAWVKRQALHFLREEFQAVTGGPVLFQLDKSHLMEALQSPFLQASELEVLQAVLKWGEHRLMRRMEDREPNLLSHTAHSVAKKGIKKRDLSDVELREILSDLLPLVRMDHVLPPNSDVLTQAIRRRLVSTPPSHMIGGDRESLRVNAWIRSGKNSGLFVRPRLFMPYYEEIKSIYEDISTYPSSHLPDHRFLRPSSASGRLSRSTRGPTPPADVPDTLYMVEGGRAMPLDVLAAALPAPEPHIMAAMIRRERKLRGSLCVQRALQMALSSRREIYQQVRLRVVREFNLPDAVADLLESYACYYMDGGGMVSGNVDEPAPMPRNMAASTSATYYESDETYRAAPSASDQACGDSFLSERMPDVAMATASAALAAAHLEDVPEGECGGSGGELELDLGDGHHSLGHHHTASSSNLFLPHGTGQRSMRHSAGYRGRFK